MLLTSVISKLGLPLLMSVIAAALSRIDNPVAKDASQAIENFETALAGGAVSAEQMAEANRHAEEVAKVKSKEYETVLSEINQSIRAETVSDDPYVRRMRPTFGYLMAVTWAAQMLGLAYVMIFETERAPAVLNGMEALSAIWGIGLSVLGIYVYKRSEDKKAVFTAPQDALREAVPPVKRTTLSVQKTTNISPPAKPSSKPSAPRVND